MLELHGFVTLGMSSRRVRMSVGVSVGQSTSQLGAGHLMLAITDWLIGEGLEPPLFVCNWVIGEGLELSVLVCV